MEAKQHQHRRERSLQQRQLRWWRRSHPSAGITALVFINGQICMLTSHLRTAGAQTDNVGKRSVTFYHRGDPGNAHWVTLNWLAARVCKAPFGSTVGGPKLFRPESDWFVWMFVLNCVSRMKQAGGHVWFLELIFSLSGSEGDSHLAAPSLHLTISNIYCDCGSRMTAKDNYTDYICT